MNYRRLIGFGDAVTHWACLAFANWFTYVFIYVACCSFFYPFNLEWMEGQTIDIVQRILNGQPVYTKPSVEYVPYIYTPLYFYVSAVVAKITGVGFFPTRLVSTLSALGVGAVICLWVRKETRDWETGCIAAGLFFATYRLSGRWFDNSRVDSLSLFLGMLCIYVFSFYRGRNNALIAAAIAAAAFFTKQSTLVIIAPVILMGFVLNWRDALVMAVATVVMIGFLVLVEDRLTDGWFYFFTVEVPAGHRIDRSMMFAFWSLDMYRMLSTVLIVGTASLFLVTIYNWKAGLRCAAAVAGGMAAAYSSRMHSYGWVNVLMPAHAALALMMGIALAFARQQKQLPGATLLIAGAIIWQMHLLYFNPKPLIPNKESVQDGNTFLKELSEIKGEVFMPELQYVQTRAGQKSYTLGMAAVDLIRANLAGSSHPEAARDFEYDLEKAIVSGRFQVVMPGRLLVLPMLVDYYLPYRQLVYPREYVAGAINFLRTQLYVRIPNKQPQ